MKVAITSTSNQLVSRFSQRFGRCAYFIVIDTETRDWEALLNPGVNTSGGAGPLAVQFIVNREVETVISGRFGPNAFSALEAAGVQAFTAHDGTVGEVFEKYMAGELERVNVSTGPGLHGGGHLK